MRISASMMATAILTASWAMSAAAEGGIPPGLMSPEDPQYQDETHIIVQACMPDKSVAFKQVIVDMKGAPPLRAYDAQSLLPDHAIKPKTPDQGDKAASVRRINEDASPGVPNALSVTFADNLNRNDQEHAASTYAAQMFMIGNTVRSQPVYQERWRRVEKDAVAVAVRVTDDFGGWVDYWYAPPKPLPHERFTDWQEPVTQEDKAQSASAAPPTAARFAKNMQVDYHPVNYPRAPKVRFTTLAVKDYYYEWRFWGRELNRISDLYYQNGDIAKLDFVPLGDPLPACDTVTRPGAGR